MGVRRLPERGGGGRNFINGDLSLCKIMDYVIQPIQQAGVEGGGGGAVCVKLRAKKKSPSLYPPG